jgi:phosphoribosylformylglycinamidine synthase
MTPDPNIPPTEAQIASHGLTPDEYARIERILGRAPNFTELGVFSVMWSEHCSYKNSRPELRKFPTDGPRVLVKAGEENAGVIDIGDGWGVAFKMESHNHPSAIEPFQGAATGVGGIIRDIFTMGARPVFSMNSLRFGPIQGDGADARANRRLFAGVVSGIAHYGNCIGIPTIGGEIYFDASYQGNPLVNVFCLGVLRHDQIARGAARGVGNPVFYVGAETGRDGLAGAAFASRDLTEESKQDRPAVQVGDPFKEKLLLEACLELLATDAVAGIQDMGAAGLTCSTCETASRGGSGVEIDLNLVPQREPGMTPYEILLSESQERMLIIVKAGREAEVRQIFAKWDLPCAEIGRVNDDGRMRVRRGPEVFVDIPARALADEAPVYFREVQAPPPEPPLDLATVPEADPREALLTLLAHPTIASKNWVYRQYDYMVRTGTMVGPGSDAAVFYAREPGKILAATTDCNALYCRLDPREGARIAVAEAARNLACSGAVPLAVTDNLNFGNPHRPENFWRLRECVEGLAEACRFFGTPVTGGNVSLYNESPTGAIDPTPTVGMVGLVEQERHVTTQAFQRAGDVILLLGGFGEELGGSQYLAVVHGRREGLPPRIDLARELALQEALRALIRMGLIRSAHDCSEGGLAVALAECCVSGAAQLGARVRLGDADRLDQALFNESQSRILVSVSAGNAAAVQALFSWRGIPVQRLGTIGGQTLEIDCGKAHISWPCSELHAAWHGSIARCMGGA